MIFLIEYSRPKGRIVTIKSFSDTERHEAETERLEMELRLNREGVDHEVVLLEAASEAALRKTHQRYFSDIEELAKRHIY
jgi:hypothetical protein